MSNTMAGSSPPLNDLMMLPVATKLGPYEIIAPLGAGGMGEVYRARDTKLGRDVAIKVLPSSLSADAERLHRFEQEACAAGALNHPNILVIHHVDTHEGAPYIVSELLEGKTLRQRMNGASTVSGLAQRRVIDYASQIAHGLACQRRPLRCYWRRTKVSHQQPD